MKQAESDHKCYLLLGSNLGDKIRLLTHAAKEIEQRIGEVTDHSGMYKSEPWGFQSDEYFVNQVVIVKTQKTPKDILENIHEIENKFGRERKSDSGYASRTIDIDILFYDDVQLETDILTIPHPRLHERRFTLAPLAELSPELVHPKFRKTIAKLLEACEDNLKVEKIT